MSAPPAAVVVYSWKPLTGMVAVARFEENGGMEIRELHPVAIAGYRRLTVNLHPPHCARKFCVVGSVICLN